MLVHCLRLLLLAASLIALQACAQTPLADPLQQVLELAGAHREDAAPDALQLANTPTRNQQPMLYQAVMAQPLRAPYRAGMLADAFAETVASPPDLISLTGNLAGLNVSRPATLALQQRETALGAAADPLAASLGWMAAMGREGSPWLPVLPDQALLPNPLRFELAMVLLSIGQSHRFLQLAFAQFPDTVTPALLRRQALDGEILPFEEPDFRRLLPLIDREALQAGMLDLVAAVARLKYLVSSTTQLPAVAWTLQTPMGQIVVDTTGQNNSYRLLRPLLVLDVGGDDRYEFLSGGDSQRHHISVLLDHQGHDQYIATTAGADPSAATLGYGILWDTEGDDQYLGTQHAQASALFGAALLVDGGGQNRFVANSHAQGHAVGGMALLLGGPGDDQYTAQTHAQGSAGPHGVAVLIDPAGNDRYTLDNTPLLRPSPQLPSHNTSMGQGAGRGQRGDSVDGRSSAGGVGLLLDLAGDDRYVAQVFAQGAGYQEGLGMLIDNGGNDHFEAAWYAMGAGAHRGAGMLLKRGMGKDRYQASHTIALGAAHDFSVGIFLDEGGDDAYQLGDLGLGAAHDNSFALFVDAKGDDVYEVKASACRALGAAQLSEWGSLREDLPNLGLFMDLGGADRYSGNCKLASNNAAWPAPRMWPELKLRSESGAGVDGEFALPFPVRALTREPKP